MHSIWQEQIDFPVYPILKRDKKTDILCPLIPPSHKISRLKMIYYKTFHSLFDI